MGEAKRVVMRAEHQATRPHARTRTRAPARRRARTRARSQLAEGTAAPTFEIDKRTMARLCAHLEAQGRLRVVSATVLTLTGLQVGRSDRLNQGRA